MELQYPKGFKKKKKERGKKKSLNGGGIDAWMEGGIGGEGWQDGGMKKEGIWFSVYKTEAKDL